MDQQRIAQAKRAVWCKASKQASERASKRPTDRPTDQMAHLFHTLSYPSASAAFCVTIDHLPDLVMWKIFGLFGICQRQTIELVCKRWLAISRDFLSLIKHVELDVSEDAVPVFNMGKIYR